MLSMVRESKFTRWQSRSIVTPSSRKQISLHAWLTVVCYTAVFSVVTQRYVVRFSAAVCGEERCVTTLKTAVQQTRLTEEGLCSLYKETRISTLARQEIRIYLMMIKKTTSVLVFLSLFVRWSLMGKPSSIAVRYIQKLS